MEGGLLLTAIECDEGGRGGGYLEICVTLWTCNEIFFYKTLAIPGLLFLYFRLLIS